MISVIVPVYNAEKYLNDCIDSILNQSYEDLELILINDGSTDSSLSICQSYNDNRIHVIDKKNSGVSDTRNVGISVAKGDYVAFVDSDDTLPNDSLSLLYNGMVQNNVDMSCGLLRFQYGNDFRPHKHRLSAGIYSYESLMSNFIDDGTLSGFLIGSACCALYKRDIISKYCILFQKEIKYNEDGLFNFEYALHAANFVVLDSVVYNYRQYGESSSSRRKIDNNYDQLIFDYIQSLNFDKTKYQIDLQFKRREYSLLLWDCLLYPKYLSFSEGRNFIKSRILSTNLAKSCLKVNSMPIHKKVFNYLIKYKQYCLIYILVKYIIPFLDSKLSR